MVEFILASQSPRRQSLIYLVGYPYVVRVADADEASITHPDPAVNVVETAVLKANTIAQQIQSADQIIIAADTTVVLAGQMLGKPRDDREAALMLQALRNRKHEVHTGLVLLDLRNGRRVERVTTAVVTMRNYSDEEIAAYVASGDPLDKAGAYAIQHPLFKPVARLDGCYTAVVGLSVCDVILALDELDVPRRADLTAVRQAHQVDNLDFPCPIYEKLL
ncbi:MAG: septum formation protein Maf [Anaerolineae bacterium]|nr:septum formation protein Maf [Anaerolineae bacterium]